MPTLKTQAVYRKPVTTTVPGTFFALFRPLFRPCPELDYLGVRTAKQDGRIRRFFGRRGIGHEQLKAIKMSIQRHDDLDRLFARLVAGRARKDTPKFQEVLEQAFSVEPFASLVRRNVVVVLPVFQRSIVVPYGFQSGRFNLIQPARFRSQSPTRILQRAGQYALEGDLLFNTPDPDLAGRKLIAIGDFGSSQQIVARAVGRLLEKNQTKLYRLDEMDRLLELIRTAGAPVVPLEQTSWLPSSFWGQ